MKLEATFFLLTATLVATPAFAAPPGSAPAPITKVVGSDVSVEALLGLASQLNSDVPQTQDLITKLRLVRTELAVLREQRAELANKLASATDPAVRNELSAKIAAFDAQIATLLSQIDTLQKAIQQRQNDAATGDAAKSKGVAFLAANPKLAPSDVVRWKEALAQLDAALAKLHATLNSK